MKRDLNHRESVRNWSLGYKILLPFFLILLLLGTITTVCFVQLITQALQKSTDERLLASQEIIFREIKKQETLLDTYADLIGYAYLIAENDTVSENLIVQQQHLAETLRNSDISIDIYSADSWNQLPSQSLRDLIDQATRSGKNRFRFTTDIGAAPALTIASPLPGGNRTRHVLILQSPIKPSFLRAHSSGFGGRTSLLSLTGEVLSCTENSHQPPILSPKELEDILNGQQIIRTSTSPRSIKYLFSAIPLGTSELILSVTEIPMTDLNALVSSLTFQGIATVLGFVLLGGIVYYQILQRQVMRPIERLMRATQAVSRGNLEFHIETSASDELGQVARSFNQMTKELKTLYEQKIIQETMLAAAQEKLRFQNILSEKNRQIEKTNVELTSHVNELSALFDLIQEMLSSLDLDILFGRILKILKDVVPCDEVVLLLYQTEARKLEIRKTLGIEQTLLDGLSFDLDEGITGEVARTRKMIHLRKVHDDPRNLHYKGRNATIGSLLSLPMVVKNELLGVVNLHKNAEDGFSDREIRLAQAVAGQAAMAIENARLYNRTREMSNTDPLTQLANRRHFQNVLEKEIAEALRYGSNFSLIMLDIDHFKRYNDAHGHLQGDVVLQEVAQILRSNIRQIDLAARFGGEEFVILMTKTTKEGARAAAEKLRLCVAEKIFAGAETSQPEGKLTLSLGVAEYPEDSNNATNLLDLADQALYRAKGEGRNRTVAWNSEAPLLPYLSVRPISPSSD
ncbi:MAG: hypothetical protein A2X84_00715 [Desulfuromonadaceae bacterium GWC2_58_13]|nr:MAG: hypothetical protein A2X84_00715 [Desulfuromonadaceae bacterium GWC2_58_13]